MARVAALGCVVCRNLGFGPTPAAVHHIHAGQQAFEAIYGSELDLLAQTIGEAHELRATL